MPEYYTTLEIRDAIYRRAELQETDKTELLETLGLQPRQNRWQKDNDLIHEVISQEYGHDMLIQLIVQDHRRDLIALKGEDWALLGVNKRGTKYWRYQTEQGAEGILVEMDEILLPMPNGEKHLSRIFG